MPSLGMAPCLPGIRYFIKHQLSAAGVEVIYRTYEGVDTPGESTKSRGPYRWQAKKGGW
jgi:hypothetical protein